MLPAAMSPSTTISEEASVSSGLIAHQDNGSLNLLFSSISSQTQPPARKPKKKRNQPGNPDPDAEVVALSPRTLMATNRFLCEVCGKGFQRDQNLQLHRRGHNLPWKLRVRDGKTAPRKKVYVCPDESCAHHDPSRALGDLTGIKKHFCRKHGEKKWSCDRCTKSYAVLSDWKAHSKTCGTREYRCDCGNLFSRKDSFATHRAYCDALAEESLRITAVVTGAAAAANATTDVYIPIVEQQQQQQQQTQQQDHPEHLPFSWDLVHNPNPNAIHTPLQLKMEHQPLLRLQKHIPSSSTAAPSHQSVTSLLLKSATMGHLPNAAGSSSRTSNYCGGGGGGARFGVGDLPAWPRSDSSLLTRDFLGVSGLEEELLSFTADGGGLGGSMDFMASSAAAAASCDRVGPTPTAAAMTKPEASTGFGLHHLPTAAATTSYSWWPLE